MTTKTIRKLHELRQLGAERLDKKHFDADPVYRAKTLADLERLVEIEKQVTLESAEGEA